MYHRLISQINMSFIVLIKSLNLYPELSATLGYDAIVKYVDMVRCLKSTIALQEPSHHLGPPKALSASVHEFVKVCLDISDEMAKLAWITLSKVAWNFDATEAEEEALQHKYVKFFMEHGLSRGLSTSSPSVILKLPNSCHSCRYI